MKRKELQRHICDTPPTWGALPLLGAELSAGTAAYLTGGTQFALTYLMYVPIVWAASLFNMRGLVFLAVIGGPWMPMAAGGHIMQTVWERPFRTLLFLLAGSAVAFLFQFIKADVPGQIRDSLLKVKTGFPNLNRLPWRIDALAHGKGRFSIRTIHLANRRNINAYVDYSIGQKIVLYAAVGSSEPFDFSNIFKVSADTCAALLSDASSEYAKAMAVHAAGALEAPVVIDSLAARLTVRGAAVYAPPYGDRADHLPETLKIALDRGWMGTQAFISTDDGRIAQNRRQSETLTALYAAIEKQEFDMVYQPIIHIPSRRIRGAEGLLRWNNRDIHMAPGEFIGIAEKAGFINEITKWVIRHTVRQIQIWRDMEIETKIAVNISSKDLSDDSVISYARECIQTSEIDPKMLWFELTERVIMENATKVKTLLEQLQRMGIGISIDDFGTGYNSLIQLVTLPISCLKIDKFFIDHIEDGNDRVVIREIIRLAHSLKMEVVAEGVETEQQLRTLEQMGCDNVQGYYFSRPLSAEKYADFFKRHR